MPDEMTEPTHQRIPNPAFSWPRSGWWFTVIGALFGGVLLVVPGLTELPLRIRIVVFVALLFAPAAVLVLLHLRRCDRAAALRSRGHNAVVASLEDKNSELARANDLISKLIREREDRNSLRIARCYVFDGKPLIELKGKQGFSVSVGDTYTVVDLDNGRDLGTFEVTDATGGHYVACCSGYMDPLWLGAMKQAGAGYTAPPPRTRAIRLLVEEDTDDRENTGSTT